MQAGGPEQERGLPGGAVDDDAPAPGESRAADPSALGRELLRGWIEQTPDYALLMLDTDGLVVSTAGNVDRVLGYARAELVGQPLVAIFTPEDLELGLDRHELEVAATIGSAFDDRWHVRKDRTRIWITGAINAVKDANGLLIGFVKVLRDRTDLRSEIETLRNRAAALAGDEEAREVFLGTLAHELRNPLAPLTNALHLLRLLDPGERMRQPLQIIERQLALMTRLVDDLMDVTRIDVGKLELRFEQMNLQAAVMRSVESVRAAADARSQVIEALLPGVPILVEADTSRFEQILVNLLNNAVKYTPPGGSIWVKATVEPGTAVIRVRDTGMGIAPEMLPRIFDLFTQERRVSASAGGGLGIGLSLVKNLVRAHGGVVEVRSDGQDKGSEFTVRLPLRQPR
jgi:PAS domain S-box-containing protein